MTFNQDSVRNYRHDGFVLVAESVLADPLPLCEWEFDRLIRDATALGLDRDDSVIGAVGVHKVANPASVSAVFSRLATSSKLAALIYFCTGWERAFFWGDALYYKPPVSGDHSSLAFHQDMHYWRDILASPDEAITAVVPLYSARFASGGVGFALGSKSWPLLSGPEAAQGDNEVWYPDVAPGHVTLHHPMVYHGSRPNLTQEPRRSVSLHFTSRVDLGRQEVTPS